ncbi:MAG: thioesterase family protein [Granulosicoccus sp.]
MTTRSAQQQSELQARITELFNHQICFNEFLGFRVESLDSIPVKIGFDMRPEMVGHFLFGRLHGGVISSVLDVAGGLAIMMGIANYFADETPDEVMSRFANLATIDLRVDYLRQGVGSQFVASSEVIRLGKRVAVTQSSLFNDEGTLIATANASYIVS